MRVLGIDPGTRIMGFGLLDFEGGSQTLRDFGSVSINPKNAFEKRLLRIHEEVGQIILRSKPDVMAVEEVFVCKNAKTTLKLGHARGVVLLAAAQHDVPVFEYAPREIKQAVVGQGGASKDQVRWMMSQMLRIPIDTLDEDAADGLAVALCHGLRQSREAILSSGGKR
ncbi:crossover junction endodeoxyribonuclease RuvC [candidate division KSB1 bacterium]|nr:crossover junction endodeoxyribonuclease RuvC [candidate division KSB1 bacterium]